MRGARLAVTALALASVGCIGPLARKPDTTADELAALRARIVELQQRVTVNELELERLREQMTLSSGRGTVSRPAVPRKEPSSPPPANAASLPLPEQGDEPPPRIAPPLEASDVEPPAVIAQPVGVRVGALPSADPATRAEYEKAYALFGEGRYAEAETAFARFLAAHPETDLSDNAAYWIGETRLARKDYSAALGAFRTAVETYPQGNKVPDALLKIGRCLDQLGAVADAADVYAELAARFPGTAAAASAAERLHQRP